jgi:SprT protein
MFKIQILSKEEQTLRNRVKERLEDIYLLAQTIYHRNFPLPELVFELKGKTAGYAHYRENKINLNSEALAKHTDETINETLPHEIAHLLAFQIYGIERIRHNPHGLEWRQVARRIGCNGDRCHSMDLTPAKKTRKFQYNCNQGHKFTLGLNLHRKVEEGRQNRICTYCRTHIFFVKEIYGDDPIQEKKVEPRPNDFKVKLRIY